MWVVCRDCVGYIFLRGGLYGVTYIMFISRFLVLIIRFRKGFRVL